MCTNITPLHDGQKHKRLKWFSKDEPYSVQRHKCYVFVGFEDRRLQICYVNSLWLSEYEICYSKNRN